MANDRPLWASFLLGKWVVDPMDGEVMCVAAVFDENDAICVKRGGRPGEHVSFPAVDLVNDWGWFSDEASAQAASQAARDHKSGLDAA